MSSVCSAEEVAEVEEEDGRREPMDQVGVSRSLAMSILEALGLEL